VSDLSAGQKYKRQRFAWRKGRDYDGQRLLAPSYELRHGGRLIAKAQPLGTNPGMWFWYALDGSQVNTCNRPASLEDVKAEALSFYRQNNPKKEEIVR
jgi:hypothetical protein